MGQEVLNTTRRASSDSTRQEKTPEYEVRPQMPSIDRKQITLNTLNDHSQECVNNLGAELLNDRDFLKQAVVRAPQIINVIPSKLQEDIKFMRELVAANPEAYYRANNHIKENPAIATAALRADINYINALPTSLSENEDFMLGIISVNGNAMDSLYGKDLQNKKYIFAAIRTNKDILEEVPRDILKNDIKFQKSLVSINYNAGAILEKRLGKLDPAVKSIITNTEKALKLLNFGEETYKITNEEGEIIRQGRFDATQDILNNRFRVSNEETKTKLLELLGERYFEAGRYEDPRQTTLVILPKLDKSFDRDTHVDTLSQVKSLLDTRDIVDELNAGNHVLVYDIGSKSELSDALKEVKSSHKCDNLVIGVHGNPNFIMLGFDERMPEIDFEKHGDLVLTTKDKDTLTNFENLMYPNGNVILLSCRTGATTPYGKNIAAALHDHMPNTTVYAPTESTIRVSLIDRQTGLVKSPQFRSNQNEIVPSYILKPK